MKDIECPYCEWWQEVNHDDGQGYEEDVVHRQQCGKCDKHFTYTTYVTYCYEAEKADCLNGGEHNWRATHAWPQNCTQMYCTMCDERRSPTEKEWKIINQEN